MGQEIVNYDEQFAKAAQAYADSEAVRGGTFLSTRGGVLSYGEDELPGNQACVIVLASVRENTYYAGDYDPDKAAAPTCYAFGSADPFVTEANDAMAPHESMQEAPEYFVPQAADCASCPMNEWGSADKGRGKACQNRRRLALIPAGFYTPKKGSRDFDLDFITDPKELARTDIAFIKLPTTSVIEWSKYVTQLGASVRRPPYGVITRLYTEPHPKHQYHVRFELIENVPDDLIPVVLARHEEAMKVVIQGYSPPEEREKQGLKGLRR